MLVNDKDIMKVNKELRRLRAENVEMKEKLDNYIPRRRVRRIFKSLKAILEADIQDDNKIYLDQLKEFIQKIEWQTIKKWRIRTWQRKSKKM